MLCTGKQDVSCYDTLELAGRDTRECDSAAEVQRRSPGRSFRRARTLKLNPSSWGSFLIVSLSSDNDYCDSKPVKLADISRAVEPNPAVLLLFFRTLHLSAHIRSKHRNIGLSELVQLFNSQIDRNSLAGNSTENPSSGSAFVGARRPVNKFPAG